MSHSCEEMIELFRKVGGKLTCRYDTKTCELKSIFSQRTTPEFQCDINTDISKTLDEITDNSSAMHKYTTFFHNDFGVEKIHENQRINSIGFNIQFVRNKKGEMISFRPVESFRPSVNK